MKYNPLVSVIIPSCNNSKYIGTCIDSVLQQTYTNIECIVVDSSNDDTIDILKKYREKDERLKYYYKPEMGALSAINYGIDQSDGEWLHVIDSDDYLNRQKIEKQLAAGLEVKNDNNFILVYSDFEIFFDPTGGMEGEQITVINGTLTKEEILNKIVVRNFGLGTPTPITMASMLLSRNILEKHKYNEKMPNIGDLEFYYRMLQSDVICIYVPIISFYYRQHLGGISKNKRTSLAGYAAYLETIYKINKDDLRKFPNLKVMIARAIELRDANTLKGLRSLLIKSNIPVYTNILNKKINLRGIYITLEKLNILPFTLMICKELSGYTQKIASTIKYFSLIKIARKIKNAFVSRLGIAIQAAQKNIAKSTLPRFANNPSNLEIELPRRIQYPENIRIGDDVSIGPGSLLKTVVQYPGKKTTAQRWGLNVQKFTPKLVIGNRVSATGSLQISALDSIIIEDDVMFASNIWICDGFHGFENADTPYKYQPMSNIAPIKIGRGCWIGQNVVIMPGVTIGEMSIIGACSVVTKDIPARSIAVGSPARIVKRWNKKTTSWEKV